MRSLVSMDTNDLVRSDHNLVNIGDLAQCKLK